MNEISSSNLKIPVGPAFGTMRCLDIAALCAGRARPLPYSFRIVLENIARADNANNSELISQIVDWGAGSKPLNVPLRVSRAIFPDSSGLPALMDFAALRDELVQRNCDPDVVEPVIPVDLIVDHSLIVDYHGSAEAMGLNISREFERNHERYSFFKWAQQAFSKLNVVPPGMGIIHQIHLEHLAKVIVTEDEMAFPEFVLGCDSHTPMVNALGVLGWGVGGIDAEAALVGEPYTIRIPRVVGVRLVGELREGATTTDLVLQLTQRLRQVGVVGDFVEFTGSALDNLTVPERATLSNMAPEYGATCGYFPIDALTLQYLKETGRDAGHVQLVEQVSKAAGLFREAGSPEPEFSEIIEIDLTSVEPSIAGPSRPQDRLPLSRVPNAFRDAVTAPRPDGGFGELPHKEHGILAIAAITSCTNTSNPSVMIGAGLLARNAVEKGLKTPKHVKTSLAPGSRVVLQYLKNDDLMKPLEALGFFNVGFGCTTCSGKSGPIEPELEARIKAKSLVACAVLSGNRNFEGRIHKSVRANYIASPLLVVAYAIAGRIDIDFESEALGRSADGKAVYLRDIWPSNSEISEHLNASADANSYIKNYQHVFEGTSDWKKLATQIGPVFDWDEGSSYIKKPPFFDAYFLAEREINSEKLQGARVLCRFGDSLTTDHITPSGEIPTSSHSGKYLLSHGVDVKDFNAYTMRRGNHEVLVRATFANLRVRNLLVEDKEGGTTLHFPDKTEMAIHQAAQSYRSNNVPLVVFAGQDYGMGSSRDWAAKGPALLGVKIIIAESFERIHRSNLIGMGILTAVFQEGENFESLGLDGSESFEFTGILSAIGHGKLIGVCAKSGANRVISFNVIAELFGDAERKLLAKGGIFPSILNKLAIASSSNLSMPVGENA